MLPSHWIGVLKKNANYQSPDECGSSWEAIDQWLSDMKASSGSLWLLQAFSTNPESEPHSSMANNSAARFRDRRPGAVGVDTAKMVS
jgi:hypothetical protein